MANSKYTRVVPRDLFNESKLLKCVGQLVLKIHDNNAPKNLTFEDIENFAGFEIGLMDEGSLVITNLIFKLGDTPITVKTTYNSKEPYPCFAEYNGEELEIFDDYGDFTDDFLDFAENFK